MKITVPIFLLAAGVAYGAGYTALPSGVKVATPETDVALQWYAPDIVRVTKAPSGAVYNPSSLAVTARPAAVKVSCSETADSVFVISGKLRVAVSKSNGVVKFSDKKRRPIGAEAAAATFTPATDAGRATYSPAQSFVMLPGEEIYGLGILQNGKMSQRGENRQLYPANTEDGIPFFQSNRGYGIYWDNYSTTGIADSGDAVTFSSEVGDGVDYYMIYGGDADGVVAGVRELTGDVPMAPLWTYGFHQSRERYKSQEEIVDVLRRYRQDGVPVDGMIQDWQYWGSNYSWNAMEFLNESFPDPKGMLDKIHAGNAHCIISIWSSFGPMTKPYRQLDEKGLLFDLETWPQSGCSLWPPKMDYPSGVRVYDCYSREARDIYWENLRRIHDLGMDAWWMDSTEPDHFGWKTEDFDHKTALGTYRSVRLAYPLMTVGGVYEHQRASADTARVFILTRSCTFGQQRYGANVWSGDVVSTWDMLRRQVPAGLNFSLTGNPNFNSDLGGFFCGSYNGAWEGKPAYENPAFRELYVRWTQFGVLTPMMRSHGADSPRELYFYGSAGEPVYDALVDAVKLRYRLLPYIYSTAHDVSAHRSSFMRALLMDFPTDKKAAASASQYMFGKALLAAPVLKANYTPEVIRNDADANAGWDKNTGRTNLSGLDNVDFTARYPHTVYLPAGTDWYYLHDGSRYSGGADITLDLCLSDNPIFVKAGSILPLGPDVQYAEEKPWDNLEIRVYPGADGSFTLYEDETNGYNYEKGIFSEIDFKWADRSRTLTIDRRKGEFPGMLQQRRFNIVLPDGTSRTVEYNGRKQTVKFR